MDVLRIVAFGISGLLFGSFLTVLVARLPRHESVVGGRSRCPRCGTEIRARDNIPILSFLLLRGRCRSCGAPVSVRYPLIEAATALLFAAAGALQPLFVALVAAPFLALMLAISLIDAEWRIVPNAIVYPALVIYAAAIAGGHIAGQGVDAVGAAIGFLAYAVPLLAIALLVPGGIGMGDVKLAALIGLVLGSLGLAYVAVAAGLGILGGGLGGVVALLVMKRGRKHQMPFGPFMAAGAAVAIFAAPPIAAAYGSLLGVA